ncbi:MAG: B12-binding domain-containing radical SAM protein [Ignavibacteriales bacterium]|nr:B12-binding domain-containing radical SAM protein [Ignavibacteriales bacterium]
MNILLVNPTFPETFWSFKHALKFISKKASFPPLGLLTVGAMLPQEWSKLLIDMNVEPLREHDIARADYVFLGGMSIQKDSARGVIERCKSLGTKIVAGGPLFTARPQEFPDVDHLVLNEAELTLPPFLHALRNGTPQHVYTSSAWANIATTPIPRWELARLKSYSSLCLQYSRGCPYDCEFCDITVLYGRVPRTKTKDQLLAELEHLYALGWRGQVFFVDDNFIGNRRKLKKEILPAIIEWMERRDHPFHFNTEASVNLADDEELMQLMVRAGFDTVFVGIESPNEESLDECMKIPNRKRDLAASVRTMHRSGLQVQGGFIVGFDSDPSSIFERLVHFVQETGIINAMVGLLNAPVGTRLYRRLLSEGRLLSTMTGDNTDFSMNFVPKMSAEALLKGYRWILENIYAPKQYYERVQQFLREYKPPQVKFVRIRWMHLKALAKSTVLLGVIGKERLYYWKLFFWSLFVRPKLFPLAITYAIYGHHFRKVFEHYLTNAR